MIDGHSDIVQIDDYWAIRRCSAVQQEAKSAYLFWTGGVWRYDQTLAMRFSSNDEASKYVAKSAGRMAVKSAFTSDELRRMASTENDQIGQSSTI